MAMLAHMTMTGEKQGKIEGSCTIKGREGTILIHSFSHNIHTPTDSYTGLATGKRIHGPINITKELDKSSPLLVQALCSGEQMKEVVIKLFRINKKGAEEHYYTIQLTGAILTSIGTSAGGGADSESVSMTYKKAVWRHEIDKKEAEDDWEAPKV